MKNPRLTTLEVREVNFELTCVIPRGGGTSSPAVALATLHTLRNNWDALENLAFAGPVEDEHFDIFDVDSGRLIGQVFIAEVTL